MLQLAFSVTLWDGYYWWYFTDIESFTQRSEIVQSHIVKVPHFSGIWVQVWLSQNPLILTIHKHTFWSALADLPLPVGGMWEEMSRQDIWCPESNWECDNLCLCQRSIYHSLLCRDWKPRSSCHLLHQWDYWPSQDGGTFPFKPGHEGQNGYWVRENLSLYRELQGLRINQAQVRFSLNGLPSGASEKDSWEVGQEGA